MNELEHFPLDWTLYLIDNDAGVILTNPVKVVFEKVGDGLKLPAFSFKFIVGCEYKITHMKMEREDYAIYFKCGLYCGSIRFNNLVPTKDGTVSMAFTGIGINSNDYKSVMKRLHEDKEVWL